MNFVKNDEPILDVAEIQLGFGQPTAIIAVFQIEVDRVARLPDLERQRRLPDLPGSNQGHRRLTIESGFHCSPNDPGNHPCKLSTLWNIYKVTVRALAGVPRPPWECSLFLPTVPAGLKARKLALARRPQSSQAAWRGTYRSVTRSSSGGSQIGWLPWRDLEIVDTHGPRLITEVGPPRALGSLICGARSGPLAWCRRTVFRPPAPAEPQQTSNSPAAPMPPPMHMVHTTCFAPRRRPSIKAWPTSLEPDMP